MGEGGKRENKEGKISKHTDLKVNVILHCILYGANKYSATLMKLRKIKKKINQFTKNKEQQKPFRKKRGDD